MVPSAILSEMFNSQVQIGTKSVFFSSFSEQNINFVGQLFKTDGTVKLWNYGNSINLAIQDHHLIKKHKILCLNKLDSKELYNIQLLANFLKPTSQAYF